MTEVQNFSRRLDKIFNDGEPTKALIIDAYIKTNPNALRQGQALPIYFVSNCSACGIEIEHKGKCDVCHCKGLEAYEV